VNANVERFPFNLVPLQVQQGIRHELISSQLVLDTRTRDDGRASRSDSGAYRETVRVKRSTPRRGSTRIDADRRGSTRIRLTRMSFNRLSRSPKLDSRPSGRTITITIAVVTTLHGRDRSRTSMPLEAIGIGKV